MTTQENLPQKPTREKILFTWQAPSRIFKKRSREFYVTAISIAAVVGFVIFLIEGPMPVILISALFFLFYIMNTTKPESVKYKITNFGVAVSGKTTPWGEIAKYFFTEKLGFNVIVFETISFPGRLELIYKTEDKENIKEKLEEFINEGETAPSYMDRTVNWISQKLPRT